MKKNLDFFIRTPDMTDMNELCNGVMRSFMTKTNYEETDVKDVKDSSHNDGVLADGVSDTDLPIEDDLDAGVGGEANESDESDESEEVDIVAALNEENRILSEKVLELEDRLLRLSAEMENQRRRMVRENETRVTYAIESFARDLLAVGDNFSRALSAVGDLERVGSLGSLIEGVEMTEREFSRILSSHGVDHFVSLGAVFDPKRHQAMVEIYSEDHPAGTITDVAQEGYMIADRILRPSMVCVSKGREQVEDKQEDKQEEREEGKEEDRDTLPVREE